MKFGIANVSTLGEWPSSQQDRGSRWGPWSIVWRFGEFSDRDLDQSLTEPSVENHEELVAARDELDANGGVDPCSSGVWLA